VFSYARSREKLKKLAKNAGPNARAGTPRESAQDADALLLAVHWSRIDDVLHQAGSLSGKLTPFPTTSSSAGRMQKASRAKATNREPTRGT
jgi:predicted dinucleotide-binding enzyme